MTASSSSTRTPSPRPPAWIIERLREITSKPVRHVVNTHFHWDHRHGNEAYPAAYPHAEIVTNQITREAMHRKGLKRIGEHVRQVPGEIARLRAALVAARSPDQRAKIQADLRLAEAYLAEVKTLAPALPTITFERTMRIYRRDREIHLLHLGRAHTEGWRPSAERPQRERPWTRSSSVCPRDSRRSTRGRVPFRVEKEMAHSSGW
jgi:cyclase